MTKTIPITTLRRNLPKIVKNAEKKLDQYMITVNGVPKVVLMSFAEYESWQETSEIMSDPGLVKAIKEGEEDIKKGRYISLGELKKDLKRHVRSSNI